MFKEYINKCIEDSYQSLLNGNDKRVKRIIEEIQSELPLSISSSLIKEVVGNTISLTFSEDYDEKREREYLISELKDVTRDLKKYKFIYTFEVTLRDLEKEIHRTIKVPSFYSLAEFGYVILAAMNAEGYHLFCFEYKRKQYRCDTEKYLDSYGEKDYYASDKTLYEMPIKDHDAFGFWYDYGDNYIFNVTLLKKENQDSLFEENATVIDGNGAGIWEDDHYLLELYHEDYKEFKKIINNNGVDEDYYPITDSFDIDKCNQRVKEMFVIFKNGYEKGE